MSHDWLLVETLGSEPAVVAQGRQTKNLVPISAFLRRNPHLMAVQTAISETLRTGKGLSSITPKRDRVIRTEVVRMTDGAIHGVHVWIGPPNVDPPDRPVPGALIWDLTNGVATHTVESLSNAGHNPANEAIHGRAFADDLPTRDLNPGETQVLAMAIKPQAGRTFCGTWDVTDDLDEPITVGFTGRALMEQEGDGSRRLICRAMNWRAVRDRPAAPTDSLAQRILNGMAQPGVHRAIVDPKTWSLLRWLDDPCPFVDWRTDEKGERRIHPADGRQMAKMTEQFTSGAATGVVRMRGIGGGWTPVHLTVNRIELDEDVYAGLISMRQPTEDELAAANLDEIDDSTAEAPTAGARLLRQATGREDEAADG